MEEETINEDVNKLNNNDTNGNSNTQAVLKQQKNPKLVCPSDDQFVAKKETNNENVIELNNNYTNWNSYTPAKLKQRKNPKLVSKKPSKIILMFFQL